MRLEPLSVDHAAEMLQVLADDSFYEFTGGQASTLAQLRHRYAFQSLGHSADGSQGWCTWILMLRGDDLPVGFIHATLEANAAGLVASTAWVISPNHPNQRMATEATRAMSTSLRSQGVGGLVAHVHPSHGASMDVARRQGLHPVPVLEDGEVRWES